MPLVSWPTGPVAAVSVSRVRKPYEPTSEPTRSGGISAFDPGRRGLRALAAVAGAVALGAAYLVWDSKPDPVTVPDRAAYLVEKGVTT